MNQNEIKFKQERDFGELFNVTFSFIGKEFKRLGTAVLYYVVPFLLLASVLGALIGIKQQNFLSSGLSPFSILNQMGVYFMISMLLLIIATTSLTCTLLGYMKLYVNKGSAGFTVSDVGKEVTRNFLPVLGASIIAGILIGIGFVLCFLPGIYVGVSLSILLPLIIFEDNNFGEAFKRSFKLVKPKFWMTLGVLVIAILIVYLISILFSLPALILGMKTFFFNLKEGQTASFDPGISYYIITSVSSLLTYVVSAIPTVLIGFLYFSLVEYNEKPDLNAKIDQIVVND